MREGDGDVTGIVDGRDGAYDAVMNLVGGCQRGLERILIVIYLHSR